MHQLRSRHAQLSTALETMIDEMVTKFKPTPEEELLRSLQVLLGECFKQVQQALERPIQLFEVPVNATVAAHLRRLAESFLTTENLLPSRNRFKADFDRIEEAGLDECLRRLQAWHTEVADIIGRFSRLFRLEDLSRFLTSFSASFAEVEIPGEHLERRTAQVGEEGVNFVFAFSFFIRFFSFVTHHAVTFPLGRCSN